MEKKNNDCTELAEYMRYLTIAIGVGVVLTLVNAVIRLI